MIIKLVGFFTLLLFTSIANAEYYLGYEQPTSSVINLNFSTATHSKRYHILHQQKKSHRHPQVNSNVLVSCGCTSEACYVPKRKVYTAAPTSCLTYGDVVKGMD